MTEKHLIWFYSITLFLIFINTLLIIINKPYPTKIIGVLAVISAFISLVGIYIVSDHIPVYGKFETVQNIVLILILLGVIYNKVPANKSININSIWFFALMFQSYILLKEMRVSSDYYMYNKLYVILFFQLRLTAIGFFAFALVNYFSSIINDLATSWRGMKKKIFRSKLNGIKPSSTSGGLKNCSEKLIHRGRNYTLLGATLYLGGEFMGSLWCHLWWGDPWHWSKGFFLASIMFLLSMLGSHLPAKLFNTQFKKVLFNIIPLLTILLTYLISH